jgi:predicted outer membrane repeat protein
MINAISLYPPLAPLQDLSDRGSFAGDKIGGEGTTIYVNASAVAGGDGSSWGSALNTIPENIRAGTKVFIAEGTYIAGASAKDSATDTNGRENSIKLNEGVEYYGGFKGDETHLSQRDPSAHKTVLSGEWGEAGLAGNAFTVVTGAKDAVLDGFQITGGNAIPDRSGGDQGTGAGGAPTNNASGQPTQAGGTGGPPPKDGPPGGESANGAGGQPVHLTPEMILRDAKDGRVDGAGGGISITDGMTVRNTEVSNNRAIKGGGIYVMTAKEGSFPSKPDESRASPTVILDNVNVHDNEAMARGGGIEAELGSSVQLTNSDLNANKSDKGGGMYLDFMSKANVVNTTVQGDQANSAGGLGADGGSSLGLSRSTVNSNSAKDEGGGIYLGTGQQNHAVVIKSSVNGNTSGGSGENTFTWHGNDMQVRNSAIGKGDVTSNPQSNGFEGIGATQKNLSDRATSRSIERLDSLLPSESAPDVNQTGGSTSSPAKSSDRIVMVDASATGKGNGKSWGDAYTNLNAALKDAALDGAQVFIKGGTYKPKGNGREATFDIPDGVRVFGGFAGTEAKADQRTAASAATVLDGDIGKSGDASDNAYHVVKGGNNIALDGLTIKNGNANGSGYNGHGGGMVNYDNTTQANPDNEHGYTNVKLNGVTFTSNNAKEGGAMYNYGQSDIEIKRSTFDGNHAQNGGAILDRVGVHTNLQDVSFTNNTADKNGGAYYADYGSRVKADGVNGSRNSAGTDGGFYYSVSRASQLEETVAEFSNSKITGNSARRDGASFAVNDMSKLYVVGNAVPAQADASISVKGNSMVTNGSAPSDTFVRKPSAKHAEPEGRTASTSQGNGEAAPPASMQGAGPTNLVDSGSVFIDAINRAYTDGSLSDSDTTLLIKLLNALYQRDVGPNEKPKAALR